VPCQRVPDAPRDSVTNASAAQVAANLAAGVGFVGQQSLWAALGTAGARSFDGSLLHQMRQDRCLVVLSWGENQCHEPAVSLDAHMYLGAEPTLAAAQCFGSGVTAFGTRRMLMSTHNGAVDLMLLPVDLLLGVCLCLQRLKDACPDACFLPSIEAAGDCRPGAIALWDIASGSARAQHLQNGVDDLTVTHIRTTCLRLLRRQQRR
jgi:hypothetical protein